MLKRKVKMAEMSDSGEYFTLPSDQSHDRSIVNTVGNFTFTLPSPKCYDEDVCVALTELIYPVSWMNFPRQEIIRFTQVRENGNESVFDKRVAVIGAGNYKNEDFIKTINEKLALAFQREIRQSQWEPPTIKFSKFQNTIVIQGGRGNRKTPVTPEEPEPATIGFRIVPIFSENMKNILGINLSDDDFSIKMFTHGYFSDQSVDLDSPYRLIFVYSDIVKPGIVGNTYAPLLRIVPVPSKFEYGEQKSASFQQLFYVPIARPYIDTVNITLRDITGNILPFNTGRSVATLHLKSFPKRN